MPRMKTIWTCLLLVAGQGMAGAAELRFAVMEFANTSPDKSLDSLGKGLQSMVTTDLAQVESLKLVERARLQDIQAELKLGKSGLVDQKTAARLGKLAGASHLVSGSFTVLGDKMRVDARVFSVQNGDILLAEKIEGDKDAFFELEKSLVKKIIETAGVKLQAKERGAVAKFHTTDFDAFKSFSLGVALFDEKKYEQSVDALRAAQAKDQDFKLATVTLAEYQQVIAKLKSRADELQTSQIDLESQTLQKEARSEVEAWKKLQAVASQKGGDPLDRLAALYLLAVAYGNITRGSHDLSKLQQVEDRFALQRIADAYVQSYFADAIAVFPKVMPIISDSHVALPTTPETVDKALAEAKQLIQRYTPKDHLTALLGNLTWTGMRDDPTRTFQNRLRLDGRQTAELHSRLHDLAVKAGAPPAWRTQHLKLLAEEYRSLGEVGRSSAYFTQLAGLLTDADAVRAVAAEVELNEKLALALARSADKELLREYLANLTHTAHGSDGKSVAGEVVSLAADAKGGQLLKKLAVSRRFPATGHWGGGNNDIYVHFGEHPVWEVQSCWYCLGTGKRSDPRRATSVRYYPDREDGAEGETLLLIDGVPRRGELSAKFEVDFTPTADFWPFRGDSDRYKPDAKGRHPEVGFVFGMRDIMTDYTKDPKTNRERPARPLHAYTVSIGSDAVSLIELTEISEEGGGTPGVVRRSKKLVRKELGRQTASFGGAAKLAVVVDLAGEIVKAVVNGKTFSFPAPAAKDRQGFYGLHIAGHSYADLHALKVTARK